MGAIVVTGSTRGIGLGLADAFLARGCSVIVSGRTRASVDAAVLALAEKHGSARVVGVACDVTSASALGALWDESARTFGGVDVWINNAGTCNAAKDFVDLPAEEIATVLDTNLRGTVLASHVALRGMLAQRRGKLFNMEGWGSRGEWSRGLTPYCTTKRALRYFTDALVKETRGEPIQIGTLSPGMVATDLLVSSWEHGAPENWLRMKWLFHFVIDPPEPVCAFLADKVLGNDKSGAHYTWMTPWRLVARFFQPRYWRRRPLAGTALERLGERG
ncbi:MAG: SDR family oxidoreductase [Polyangiaceae bacterium]|nr:SDR family oxidoreductase [Polyangiaceae bacterium]